MNNPVGTPRISVIIPAYNSAGTIGPLLQSLADQSVKPHEIIVVDDTSSDDTAPRVREFPGVMLIRNETNRGPAVSRNRGIAKSSGEILAFVDSDCVCERDWIERITAYFKNPTKDALMGKVVFRPRDLLARAICDLGWPAGGTIGFEKIWKVGPDGRTRHISSCNFAARKSVAETHGVFSEAFPLAGGEDVELSERWSEAGVRIYYGPDMRVQHAAMNSFSHFVRWCFLRGRSNRHIQRNVGAAKSARMLSEKTSAAFRIIAHSFRTGRFLLAIPLFFLMQMLQLAGYLWECLKPARKAA